MVFRQTASIPQATKPILSFAGDQWDTEMELPDGTKLEWRRVRSLLVDFFRGPAVKTVRRTGLELMHSFTLTKGKFDTKDILTSTLSEVLTQDLKF